MRFGEMDDSTGERVLVVRAEARERIEAEQRERKAREAQERQRREDVARGRRVREGELAQARARVALSRLIAAGPVMTGAEARQRLALAHAAGVVPWQFAAADLGVERNAAGVVLTPGDPVARRCMVRRVAARDADLMGAIGRASDVLGLSVVIR